MRALYEIDSEIVECVDTETGEIIDAEKLDALEMERDEKIESIILWRKDILAEAKAVKEEADSLTDRVKKLNNKADSLKEWIAKALNGDKFKTTKCSVSYRASKSTVIDNFADIPEEYYKLPNESWVSKDAVKKAIEEGKTIPGAHIEEKTSIIIK